MKQETNSKPRTPANAQAAHATAIFDLFEKMQAALPDCTKADWQDVGSTAHARELIVRAAVALGAIPEEQARDDHGVEL